MKQGKITKNNDKNYKTFEIPFVVMVVGSRASQKPLKAFLS